MIFKGVTMQQKIYFEDLPLSKIHYKVAFGGIGGQFCDGYILGVVGIALALATTPLGLNTWWLGAIGAASLLGLFLGSLLTGLVADRIGRKPIFVWTMPLFAFISLLQFFADSALELFILRLILGFALGADYAVGISLVSEITPKKFRGKLLSAMMVGWVAGYSLAYCVGFFMQYFGNEAYRWILLSSAFPALLVAILRINVPSSPLWLMQVGKVDKAKVIVAKYFGSNVLLHEHKTQEKGSYFELFNKKYIRNTAVGAVFYGAQVVPYFAISTFIPVILASLNVEDPYLGGIIYNLFLFVGVLLGFYVINKISRRSFVVGSFYILSILSAILAAWSNIPQFMVITLISLFSCVLAGAGVLEFAYTPELFPTKLRGSGVGFVVASSRISGALGTFFLPFITKEYSTAVALWVVFATVLLAGIFCHFFAPETTHKENV